MKIDWDEIKQAELNHYYKESGSDSSGFTLKENALDNYKYSNIDYGINYPLGSSSNYWTNIWTTINSTPSYTTYAVVDLPQEGTPEAIYVGGLLKTLGALGTNVECAFAGNQLVFSPGVLENVLQQNTLIIQYSDVSYHYNVCPSSEWDGKKPKLEFLSRVDKSES